MGGINIKWNTDFTDKSGFSRIFGGFSPFAGSRRFRKVKPKKNP